MVPIETRLILNDRVFGFPFGKDIPACLLQAAFELGKMSAPLGVDANPFLRRERKTFVRSEPYRRAEAVAWLRGHYLAREVIELREAA